MWRMPGRPLKPVPSRRLFSMQMTPRLSALEPYDLPGFARLLRQDGRSPQQFVEWHEQHAREERRIIVARIQEEVAGFVSVLSSSACSAFIADDTLELDGLYVSVAHRGQGLGRALMTAAESVAVGRGRLRCGMAAHQRAEAALIHFLTNRGYVHAGETIADRPWDPLQLMVKSLVPTAFVMAHSAAA